MWIQTGLALFALIATTAMPVNAAGTGADIIDSGSTNTLGFVLHVSPSGAVVVDGEDGAPPRNAAVAPALAARFFTALDAAEPPAAAPVARCMKSASFGTTVTVRYGDVRTPDLTCPAGDWERGLASLVSDIVRTAGLADVRFRNAGHFKAPPGRLLTTNEPVGVSQRYITIAFKPMPR